MTRFKPIFMLIFCLMLTVIPPVGQLGAADDAIVLAANTINVTVDGVAVVFPDQQPYADANQRTLVPIRYPMEAMGVTATWNGDDQTATLTKGTTTAVFTVGQADYTVNGVKKTMDTVAVAEGGRTLFPIRFAAEAFGATVTWDGATSTAVITTTEATADIPKPEIRIYPQDKARMIEDALLQFWPTGNIQGIKVQCVNNDAININWLGRRDDGYYGDYAIYSLPLYGTNLDYQVQPGEVLIFDVWIEYWPDGEPVQEALVYDDYTFTVPDYN